MQQATTIKRFRSHPLYIVSILWKYLFILLVPVIRGLYYVIINSFSLENGFQFAVNISNWAKGAWMDIAFLLAFLSLGILLWLNFTIEVSEKGLLIHRGVLKREVRFLPVSRYNCLSVVSPMSVRLFGGAYLRVDTPGGGLKQADLLMMLRTKDCRQIIKLLQLPESLEQPAHTRSYTPKNRYVFVLAMVTSNSFAGVLLISTFVTQSGNILGEQFSEMLYGTFENVTRTLAFGVPPAAFALACILFFGYLCAFVVSLSRHANFHVIRRKNLLEVRAGLLTKRSYRIAADKIAYLDIRRSLLTCLLGVYSIFLSTVGYGKFKDDVGIDSLCAKKTAGAQLAAAAARISSVPKDSKAEPSAFGGQVYLAIGSAAGIGLGGTLAAAGTVPELGAANPLGQLYGKLSAGVAAGGQGHRPVYSGCVL